MKKINNLRELQLVSIYIYKELLKACEENGIKLYLLAGTLLGAVRHKGFIPWDDDIDVGLSREDFNKLLKHTNGKLGDKCRIIDPNTDTEYKGLVPVVVYENSYLESKQFKEQENLKIGISIFVYDGAPNSEISRKYYYTKMYVLRAMHALCRADFKHVNTKIAKIMGPILSPFFRSKDVYKFKKMVLKYQQKYSFEKSKYVAPNVDCGSKKEIVSKSDFVVPINMDFEDIKSYSFSCYREYLTNYYGDYMQLPPTEHQIPKHNFYAEIEDDFIF